LQHALNGNISPTAVQANTTRHRVSGREHKGKPDNIRSGHHRDMKKVSEKKQTKTNSNNVQKQHGTPHKRERKTTRDRETKMHDHDVAHRVTGMSRINRRARDDQESEDVPMCTEAKCTMPSHHHAKKARGGGGDTGNGNRNGYLQRKAKDLVLCNMLECPGGPHYHLATRLRKGDFTNAIIVGSSHDTQPSAISAPASRRQSMSINDNAVSDVDSDEEELIEDDGAAGEPVEVNLSEQERLDAHVSTYVAPKLEVPAVETDLLATQVCTVVVKMSEGSFSSVLKSVKNWIVKKIPFGHCEVDALRGTLFPDEVSTRETEHVTKLFGYVTNPRRTSRTNPLAEYGFNFAINVPIYLNLANKYMREQRNMNNMLLNDYTIAPKAYLFVAETLRVQYRETLMKSDPVHLRYTIMYLTNQCLLNELTVSTSTGRTGAVSYKRRASPTGNPVQMGVFRQGLGNVKDLPPYKFNDKKFRIRRGREHFNPLTRRIEFPPEEPGYRQKQYYTIVGPSVAVCAYAPARTNANISAAATRVISIVKPEIAGLHEELRENQKKHFGTTIFANGDAIGLRDSIALDMQAFTTTLDEIYEHVSDVHPKRMLREATWQRIRDDGLNFRENFGLSRVEMNLKMMEMLPVDKLPRAIYALGTPASLVGFMLATYMKKGMENATRADGVNKWVFVKEVRQDILDQVMVDAVIGEQTIMYEHSDDSIYCVGTGQERKRFNIDVSKADASYGEFLFKAIVAVTPKRLQSVMSTLIKQLKADVHIQSADKKHKIVLRVLEPFCMSGHTFTTLFNQFAGYFLSRELFRQQPRTVRDIELCGAKVGLFLKVEQCATIHDLQFLKHSPAWDTAGDLRAVQNFGVVLRLMGTARGDVVGHGDLKRRGREHQAQMMHSTFAHLNTPIGIGLSRHWKVGYVRPEIAKQVTRDGRYMVDKTPRPPINITTVEYLRRYKYSPEEISYLESAFLTADYGDICNHPSLAKGLEKDYGITTDGNVTVPHDYIS